MKKEILAHNSEMVDIMLKELKEYVKSKEDNQNEKIVEKKKPIKGIRKYRLGYDYLFLPKRTFKYKGDLIGGISIMVLFKIYDVNGNEILFETKGEELKEQTIKLKNGEECYLSELFYCSFDKELFKENQTFDFSPTMNVIMSNCRIAMEIHSYTKDIEVRKVILEPENIDREELPLNIIVPAFAISELKTAFQIGFIIYIPFLVVDLIVSSTLMSMGMFMLPPAMISLPFKLLLFVMVDGWNLLVKSLIESFI